MAAKAGRFATRFIYLHGPIDSPGVHPGLARSNPGLDLRRWIFTLRSGTRTKA
jgi:hypothetical protein